MLVQVVVACVRLPNDMLGIGNAGGLPWPRLPADLERFRVITSGSGNAVVIMGRRTWESLPETARPLRNRLNIVLASDGCSLDRAVQASDGILRVSAPDLGAVIAMLEAWSPRPSVVSIIGGAALFEAALAAPWCTVAHVTHIDVRPLQQTVACDTAMSAETLSGRWAAWSSSPPRTCEGVGRLTFVTYVTAAATDAVAASVVAGAAAPHAELQYADLIRNVMADGEERRDRTGTGALSLFGAAPLRFDLRYGSVPVLTTKRVFWRGVVEELLWFMRGSTDAHDLAARNVHIWDANGSRAALDAAGLHDRAEGDLGPCFVGGTLVCMSDGYSGIEAVKCGDVVHSHLGNLRTVTQVMRRWYTGAMVDVHVSCLPGPIQCTPEHPFYVRQRATAARFVAASLLQAPGSGGAYYVGMKVGEEDAVPWRPWEANPRLNDPNFWWVMGLFVGCGGILVDASCAHLFLEKDGPSSTSACELRRQIPLAELVEGGPEGYATYASAEPDVVAVLGMFSACSGMRIPGLVHAAPRRYIREFLKGVAAGRRPGCGSPGMALGLQRLNARLYRLADDGACATREGSGWFVDDGYMWHAVQRVEVRPEVSVLVYNLAVEVDESYVVHNAAVHNCYGFQFRHYGAPYVDAHTDYRGQGVDQIAEVVRLLQTDPTSRRIILSAWNPAAQPQMALPPCHVLCQFHVSGDPPALSCHMYQRSVDIGLGLPFNIASYALLTCLLAHVTGMRRGELIISMGDAHIYLTHVEAMRRQLANAPRAFPGLKIEFDPHDVDFPTGAHRLRADQFRLVGYTPHPSIPMPMAV